MTDDEKDPVPMPTRGGSYERLKDGSLREIVAVDSAAEAEAAAALALKPAKAGPVTSALPPALKPDTGSAASPAARTAKES